MKLEQKIIDNFTEYSNYVNYERAIPHLYDGLKPVTRRILYTMYKMKLFNKGQTKKSSNIIGQTMALHPHGDTSIYAALVRMSQPFSNNIPLIEGRGNFGSLDNDPAAMRYTEAKLSKMGDSLVELLNKKLVPMVVNFDGTEEEPEFLLPKVPMLLINGAVGIGVGMSTNIPAHNLSEIIDATVAIFKEEIKDTKDLLKYIKGPDFYSGCSIVNKQDFIDSYSSGKGIFKLRAIFNFNQGELVITNFPFKVAASKVEEQLNEVINSDILGIVNTTSNKEELRIRLRKNTDEQSFIRWICANTSCEVSLPMEIRAISPLTKKPEIFSLKDFLSTWLIQYETIITKDLRNDLKKAKDKLEVTSGLQKAIKSIDEIIQTIKQSENRQEAKNAIIKIGFTENQADAILNIRLSRLTKLNGVELEKEQKLLEQRINDINLILTNKKQYKEYIINSLIAEKIHGQERKSKILNAVFPKIIKKKSDKFFITTHNNHIKIYNEVPRGKYITGDKNNPIYVLHDNFVTPVKNANESIISNVHTLLEGEDDIFHLSVDGLITRTKSCNLKTARKAKAANQEVFTAFQAQEGFLLIETKKGKKVQFNLNEIKPTGRGTKGVSAIKLGNEQLESIKIISTPEKNVKTKRGYQF